MNERIRELYEQTRLHAKTVNADLDPQGWMDEYHKKFAELIVAECASIVEDAVDHREPASTYVDKINQHFGVEE
jgi:hypothetical protein